MNCEIREKRKMGAPKPEKRPKNRKKQLQNRDFGFEEPLFRFSGRFSLNFQVFAAWRGHFREFFRRSRCHFHFTVKFQDFPGVEQHMQRFLWRVGRRMPTTMLPAGAAAKGPIKPAILSFPGIGPPGGFALPSAWFYQACPSAVDPRQDASRIHSAAACHENSLCRKTGL